MLVLFVSLLHILWATLLLLNQGALHIAATWALVEMVGPGHWLLRAFLYASAGILPILLCKYPGSILGLLSVLPQQALVTLSGISALVAITNGHYADGVARPALFIMMDQAPYIVLAILHAIETLDLWKK